MKTTHLSPRFKEKMTTLFSWIAMLLMVSSLLVPYVWSSFLHSSWEKEIFTFVPQLFFKTDHREFQGTHHEMANFFKSLKTAC